MENIKKKPNILFLMTDQQRFDAMGCANSAVKTPNLDKLAETGIRFSQAVCNAPPCVPSRYSMMTGLYPSQVGVRHNGHMCKTDAELPLPVIPQRFHELGYQTAAFGKAHWYLGTGTAPDIEIEPSNRGFETQAQARWNDPKYVGPDNILMDDEDHEAHSIYTAEVKEYGPGQESILGYTGATSKLSGERHREGWLTKKTLEFLDNDRDKERPLFLYVSFVYPHAGSNVPPEYEGLYNIEDIPDRLIPPWDKDAEGHANPEDKKYDDIREEWIKRTPEERRMSTLRYYALCTYVDEMFGRIIKKLDDIGELENTFIMFVSDHGEMLGDRFHRFTKYCLYDGAIRVPMIISGAGIPEELRGTVDDRPAELVDVLPTLMHVAGAEIPAQISGDSLLNPPCRVGTFTEFHRISSSEEGSFEAAPAYAWRKKDWKLILYIEGDIRSALSRVSEIKGELYNLKEDPQEWTNLYYDPSYLEIKAELSIELLMHLACVWTRFPRKTSAKARLK